MLRSTVILNLRQILIIIILKIRILSLRVLVWVKALTSNRGCLRPRHRSLVMAKTYLSVATFSQGRGLDCQIPGNTDGVKCSFDETLPEIAEKDQGQKIPWLNLAADKYVLAITKKLVLGCISWSCSVGHFLVMHSSSVDRAKVVLFH